MCSDETMNKGLSSSFGNTEDDEDEVSGNTFARVKTGF